MESTDLNQVTWTTRFIVAGVVILFTWALGVFLDRRKQPTAATLFWTFQIASLSGVAYTFWALSPLLQTPGRIATYLLLAFIGWRVSYFPFMVFAGTFAAYMEWIQVKLARRVIFLYPSFLFSFAGLHLLAALGIYLPMSGLWWWPFVVLPFLIQGLMVSFAKRADLTLLPDRYWRLTKPLPPLTLPRENPYLTAIRAGHYSPWQRLLPMAAGSTYGIIPNTPWARVVKGVLEAEFVANPSATSHSRVEEHYYGYLLAHPVIGKAVQDV